MLNVNSFSSSYYKRAIFPQSVFCEEYFLRFSAEHLFYFRFLCIHVCYDLWNDLFVLNCYPLWNLSLSLCWWHFRLFFPAAFCHNLFDSEKCSQMSADCSLISANVLNIYIVVLCLKMWSFCHSITLSCKVFIGGGSSYPRSPRWKRS